MAPELLTVIVASVSCVAFCLVILLLVVTLYRKDPLCCRFRPHTAQDYTEDPSHYHSRHSLIGLTHPGLGGPLNQRAVGPQPPGRLFIIGKPNDYHLDGALPRLPSYESVRKKDRQRHIHGMIAQRFGLIGCHGEPPPPYEETFQFQSLEVSPAAVQHLDLQLSVLTQGDSLNLSEGAHSCDPPPSAPLGPAST